VLLGVEVDVPAPEVDVAHVPLLGSDIEVPQEHQGVSGVRRLLQEGVQALQPVHLIDELVALRGLAIGHVDVDDPRPAHRPRDQPPGRVLLVVQQVPRHLGNGLEGEQGHPVVGLLAEDLGVIAQLREAVQGETVVGGLDLL
jgi:hypothetical protein